MNALMKTLALVAAGAAAMYYLDPETGRRRRALVRDKGAAAGRDLKDSARATGRHASNKMRGAVAKVESGMDDAPVTDELLQAQIRSKLGRTVERPGDVEVEVNDGHVVLSGSASAGEVDSLARTVAGMQGVSDVENRISGNESIN
jgi:hypothetical protein